MLIQRGFESDPVKAWKDAQEKVKYNFTKQHFKDMLTTTLNQM